MFYGVKGFLEVNEAIDYLDDILHFIFI